MSQYSPVWPHGDIEAVFDNVFIVRGTNIIRHDGMTIQHSRTMTILRQGDALTLVNTVRLSDEGLAALDLLGQVTHVLSIGAFHGRDDAFYCDKYQASLLSVQSSDAATQLTANASLPITGLSYHPFKSAKMAEGVLYFEPLKLLVTCDSIKNWCEVDEYFSEETGRQCLESGEIAPVHISSIWLSATETTKADFEKLLALDFHHLVTAHGDVLKSQAHKMLSSTISELT